MKKITIIEDNKEVRENIAEILALSGYDVSVARDGEEGIGMINILLPDLIFCDVNLPTISGYRVLETLRKSDHLRNIPFIFLTANAGSEDIRKGMNLGADDYLIKPFDSVDLLDAVTTRLRKKGCLNRQTGNAPSPFFDTPRGLEALEKIGENQEMRKYAKREVIFQVGQVARYMYVIKSGRIKIFQSNRLGKELVTDIFTKGDFFGAEDLVFEVPHHDSAMALELSELQLIPKLAFLNALEEDGHFASLVIKQLASIIEKKEQRMLSIAYDSVRKRIANALIKLSEHRPPNGRGVKVLREDLSNMVGTAKESVSRTLSEFKNEDLIEINGGKITILRRDKLANLQG